MENCILEDNKYYEPKMIITYLENILKKDFNSIKTYVDSSGINASKEQIEMFLEKKFMEENPELKEIIESPKYVRSKELGKMSHEDLLNESREIVDSIAIGRYMFEPYTLKYFHKYVEILKCKINKLFDIIQCIGTRNTSSIDYILTDLDVVLDDNGNILGSDIIRLIEPTIYNIEVLSNKIKDANDLNTYLSFKMSEESICANGFLESEIYPSMDLQIKSLFFYFNDGYVSLTEKQKESIRQKDDENVKTFIKTMLDDLYD